MTPDAPTRAHPTSTGTPLLDELIDGVYIGDNLVLTAGDGAPVGALVERFVAHARGETTLVRVNVAAAARPEEADVVVDWSPVVTGVPSDIPGALTPEAGFDEALATLHRAEEAAGVGAVFVFDALTAVQRAWGPHAALELFLSACPRLYRRRSLAMWPVNRADHRPGFLRRLTEITQVVVEVTGGDDIHLEVTKADGRPERVVGREVRARFVDGELTATTPVRGAGERLGVQIREQRLRAGISQAEAARRVGISPSALSQVERGVRGLSGETLVRLWEVLDVPFGPVDGEDPGYRLARRSGRDQVQLGDGILAERLAASPRTGACWFLELAAGASAGEPPFAVKAPETIVVIAGVLDLHLGGRTETLHEGDAVTVTDTVVSGWANPGTGPCQVLWQLHT